jgi:chromosome partitioning protein
VAILASRASRDRDALRALEDVISPIALSYDLVVFDSPPHTGTIQDATLIASHYLVIPTTFDKGSIDGLTKIAKRVSSIRTLNPDLELLGVVLFNFAAQATAMTAEVRRKIADGLGEIAPVLQPPIRSSPKSASDMREYGFLAHEYEAQADSAPPWYEGGTTRYSRAAPRLAGDYQQLTDAILHAYRTAVLAATGGGSP